MKSSKLASLALAVFLQFAPFASRAIQSLPFLVSSPAAIVLKWVIGALALAGTYHTVSAGSAVLQSATSITGTVGTRLSYQIKINDGQRRTPESWVVSGQAFNSSGSTMVGMPPGLSMALSTGIISGVPTQNGTYLADITAYESRNLGGHSLEFTLTFTISGGASPPTITAQPSGGSVSEGASFSFTVTASGTGTLTYQWFHDSQNMSGATAATLTLNPVQTTDAGDYTVEVSNSGGTTTSSAATLTVTAASSAPAIATQPIGGTFHEGESLTLSVVATGTQPLAYQWQLNGTDLPGQTAATLSIPAVSAQNSGDYLVVVSGTGGSVTSTAATVKVIPLSVQLLGIKGGVATLLLQTIPGRTYLVEAADGAVGSSWLQIGTLTATGTTSSVTDSQATKAIRFWRYGSM